MRYTLKNLESVVFKKSTAQKFHKEQLENGFELRSTTGLADMLLSIIKSKRILQTYYSPYTFESHRYEFVFTGRSIQHIVGKSRFKDDMEIIDIIGSTECYVREVAEDEI